MKNQLKKLKKEKQNTLDCYKLGKILNTKTKPLFGNNRSSFSNRATRRKFSSNRQSFLIGSHRYRMPVKLFKIYWSKSRKIL